MEVLIWALKFLLGTMIAFPFVGGIGCAWINHYFKSKQKWGIEWAKTQFAIAKMARDELEKE